MNGLRKVTTFAVLLALGVALWVLETLLPPLLPLPGAKLGLSNIVVLLTMLLLGPREGVYLAVLRSLLGSLLGGTFLSVGFVMSFGGALMSALAMAFCLRFSGRIFSLIGISIIGAVVHNLVQLLLVYYLFVRQPGILYYLPFLLWVGLLSGGAIGAILVYLQRRLALTGDFLNTNIEWNR